MALKKTSPLITHQAVLFSKNATTSHNDQSNLATWHVPSVATAVLCTHGAVTENPAARAGAAFLAPWGGNTTQRPWGVVHIPPLELPWPGGGEWGGAQQPPG